MASPQHFQDAAKDFAVVSAPQADLHAADAELDSAVLGAGFRIFLDLLRNNLYHSNRAIRMPVRFCLFRLDDLNRIRGKEVYDTILRCSEDGEQLFSSKFNGTEGKFLKVEADWLDTLSLLSLGFGKAL